MPKLCEHVEDGLRCKELALYGIRDQKKTHCKIHKSLDMISSPVGSLPNDQAIQKRGISKRVSFKDFVRRAIETHGNIFSYNKDKYTMISEKTEITCLKCSNVFPQSAIAHIKGAGCPNCANIKASVTKSLSFEEFERRSRLAHGNKYTYHKETYVNSSLHTTITCDVHGDFEQYAESHFMGHGCKMCSATEGGLANRIPYSEFISRATETHGDAFIYYEDTYTGIKGKITVKCTKNELHPVFTLIPKTHIESKGGCPECARESLQVPFDEFVARSNKEHGEGSYTYDETTYTDMSTDTLITCKVEGHGSFWQNPYTHANRGSGCPMCGVLSRRLSYEEFVCKAEIVHGKDKYIYDKDSYVHRGEMVSITCLQNPLHPVFTQQANSHLQGSGCTECFLDRLRITFEEFVMRAHERHGNKYEYIKDTFTSMKSKTTIICKVHGEFPQNAMSHLCGCGCPKCYLKTQNVVRRVVEDWASTVGGSLGDVTFSWCVNSRTCRKLPFDIVVYIDGKPRIIIEVDGPHHFVSGSIYSSKHTNDHIKQIQKDTYKAWCAHVNKCTTVRINQADVWEGGEGWEKALVCSMNEALVHFTPSYISVDQSVYFNHHLAFQKALADNMATYSDYEEDD